MCTYVCVCVRERERGRGRERVASEYWCFYYLHNDVNCHNFMEGLITILIVHYLDWVTCTHTYALMLYYIVMCICTMLWACITRVYCKSAYVFLKCLWLLYVRSNLAMISLLVTSDLLCVHTSMASAYWSGTNVNANRYPTHELDWIPWSFVADSLWDSLLYSY